MSSKFLTTGFEQPVRRMSALVGVLAVALMLPASAQAADWSNARGDAGNTGSSAETLTLPLTERWHSSAPDVEENGAVVSNGIVYMSSEDGQLYAFDPAGAPVTGFPVVTSPNYGAPAVDAVNAKVYVLASNTLFAFNLNGTPAWTADVGSTGSNYNVGPIVDGGFVYLKANDTLKKYNSAGGLQWSVPSAGNSTQPAIMGADVYVNTNAGEIRKYDKTTGVEVTTAGFPVATAASEAGIAVVDGRIYHKADQLYAYNASTGALAWSAPAGGDSTYYDSPAVSNGVVYVYGWDSKLYAFDAATGATKAGFPTADLATPSDRNYGSPTVAGDLVFVGAGTTQKLKVLGAAGTANAGTVLEEHLTFSDDPQGFDVTSPVVSGGIVYVMLDGGGLYAFLPSDAPWTGGGVTINAGAACTESSAVTLAIDVGSNPDVAQMRISEDPLFASATFEPVASSKAFTLSVGFGTKTVYVQFQDGSEQLSNVFNDQIQFAASCAPTLTVAKAGSGSGLVASTPAGISCGATCSAEFADGASVGLTPTPDEGSTFAGWSGACTGTGACTVTMSGDQSVTATFTATGETGVSIVSSSQPETITSGSAGLARFEITNAGPDALEGAYAIVTVPAGIMPVSATSSQGGCTGFSGQQAICLIGTIPAGSTVTLDVVGQTPPGFPPTSSLGIGVSLAGSGIDPIQQTGGPAVTAATGNEAAGFVPPGGTISTGTEATPENNTIAGFRLPNSGAGAPIVLRAETEGAATFCGGRACRGKIMFLSPFAGYDDPHHAPLLTITWDKTVAGKGTKSKLYVQKEPGGPVTRVERCVKASPAVAVPSPCIHERVKIRGGDIRFKILILSMDPRFARR